MNNDKKEEQKQFTTCTGKADRYGYCDTCYQLIQGTSVWCGRLIPVPEVKEEQKALTLLQFIKLLSEERQEEYVYGNINHVLDSQEKNFINEAAELHAQSRVDAMQKDIINVQLNHITELKEYTNEINALTQKLEEKEKEVENWKILHDLVNTENLDKGKKLYEANKIIALYADKNQNQ